MRFGLSEDSSNSLELSVVHTLFMLCRFQSLRACKLDTVGNDSKSLWNLQGLRHATRESLTKNLKAKRFPFCSEIAVVRNAEWSEQ